MTQETLGSSNNQRLPEVPLHLAAQEVEVLRWRRRERDVHVHIRRIAPIMIGMRVIRELYTCLENMAGRTGDELT